MMFYYLVSMVVCWVLAGLTLHQMKTTTIKLPHKTDFICGGVLYLIVSFIPIGNTVLAVGMICFLIVEKLQRIIYKK